MLPFFFRHYDDLVDRYFVHDDGSTDGSQDILRAHPRVELYRLPDYSDPRSRVLSAISHFEDVWRPSRGHADWVILTDIDEHLYHRDLSQYLETCLATGVTMIPALGYQMLSEDFPEDTGTPLCRSRPMGAPCGHYSKLNVFSPDAIDTLNYAIGRHTCKPTGQLVSPDHDELLLLHYKYLGFDRIHQRHQLYATRSREDDVANRWGYQYFWSRDELQTEWREIASRLIDISDPTINHAQFHPAPRWWVVGTPNDDPPASSMPAGR